MGRSEPDQRVAGLVGRERVCAVIDRLLERAERGESGSLVLRGEAGVGKTALLRYAAARAVGTTVLSVTGIEAESDLDFAGLHSLVRPIVGLLPRLPAPQRDALAAGLGLMPAAGSDRFLVSAGVLSLLAEAAEECPLLCVIDDAQWLDTPSADALVFTARRVGCRGNRLPVRRPRWRASLLRRPGPRRAGPRGARSLAQRASCSTGNPELAPACGSGCSRMRPGTHSRCWSFPPASQRRSWPAGRCLPDAIPLNSRLQAAFSQRVQRLPDSTQAALLLAAAEADGEPAIVLRAAAALGLASDRLTRRSGQA